MRRLTGRRAIVTGGAQGIGRAIADGELVPTAIFLASDDASYYTGPTLGPNGGDVTL